MRVVGYVRVSTRGQVDDGYGLDVQALAVKAWAKAQGHRLVTVCRDEGVSGTLVAEERAGLAEALDLLRAGKADAVVVHRLDRLARTLTVQEAALALVWRHGGRVFTVDGGEVHEDDPDDPMRTFVRQVMGAASELERSMVVLRLRSGRRLKADRGGYAGGRPGYGRRAEGHELVEHAEEAAVVARIVELRAGGASLRGIADALDAEGLTTRLGKRWHPTQLARILERKGSVAA